MFEEWQDFNPSSFNEQVEAQNLDHNSKLGMILMVVIEVFNNVQVYSYCYMGLVGFDSMVLDTLHLLIICSEWEHRNQIQLPKNRQAESLFDCPFENLKVETF